MDKPEINMKVSPPITQKVSAALQVLEYLRDQEQPTFIISGPDDPQVLPQTPKALDPQEVALKKATLQYLVHYFHGEMD
tara:strand:- start:25 stop:261 length:237 start_codon:yes stop_codon:yes gene_type:complete